MKVIFGAEELDLPQAGPHVIYRLRENIELLAPGFIPPNTLVLVDGYPASDNEGCNPNSVVEFYQKHMKPRTLCKPKSKRVYRSIDEEWWSV